MLHCKKCKSKRAVGDGSSKPPPLNASAEQKKGSGRPRPFGGLSYDCVATQVLTSCGHLTLQEVNAARGRCSAVSGRPPRTFRQRTYGSAGADVRPYAWSRHPPEFVLIDIHATYNEEKNVVGKMVQGLQCPIMYVIAPEKYVLL